MYSNIGDTKPGSSGMIGPDEVALNERAGGTSARPANLDAITPDPNHIANSRGCATDGVVGGLNVDAEASLIPRAWNGGTAGISPEEIAANHISTTRRDEDLFIESVDGQSADRAVASSDFQSRKQILAGFNSRAVDHDSNGRVIAVSQRVGARAPLGIPINGYRFGNCRQNGQGSDGMNTCPGDVERNRVGSGSSISLSNGITQSAEAAVVGACYSKREGVSDSAGKGEEDN